jgi:predicted SprT family Zn-dependent metalloprotease
MTAEITGIQAADPERDAAVAVDGLGNWNVHSNVDCVVHSNDETRNVHPNDAVDGADQNVPTQETSAQLQALYDYLKSTLIENKLRNCSMLPDCLITYQRRSRSYGYFVPDRFGRKDGQRTDEIALNPKHFGEQTLEEVISTMAHEMVHLWQHHFGEKKPARLSYHNKEWADAMEAIGLIPSDTGTEGGKRTGDSMSHYILPGGAFALAVERLLATGFEITWREVAPELVGAGERGGEEDGGGSLSGKRTKFACPRDGCQNAWAKPSASLMCAIHREKMLPAAAWWRASTSTVAGRSR